MKTVKLIFAVLGGVFLLAMVISVVSMTYLSNSQENLAREDCAKFIAGEMYDKSVLTKNSTYEKETNEAYYSYLYPMNFDEAAECRVYVDNGNKIIKKDLVIR